MKKAVQLNFILFATVVLFIFTQKARAQVSVTSSDSVNCLTTCTTLTANLMYGVPTDAAITEDNDFPVPITSIGFTFSFYGISYANCLIGPNGTVCFNTALWGFYDDYGITSTLLGTDPVKNSVCGLWSDIDIRSGGSITYYMVGVAPNRKFVANFCHVPMYDNHGVSCLGEYVTSQIILFETTNIVEVHVTHKTICTAWNGGHAIIGVQNAAGTTATTAPGRDWTPNWNATDEAWRFTPVAGPTYLVASIPYAPIPDNSSTLHWYNDNTGAYLGTGTSKVVCPSTTTTYKVGALNCIDTSFGYYTVIVHPIPAISGTLHVCEGSTNSLSNSLAGGTWSSSTTGVATITGSGIVTGVSSGTTIVTYTLAADCFVTAIVTVNPQPSSITGTASICGFGITTTLSDPISGGTWTSSDHAVATISSSGVVTSVGSGTTTISYTLSGGCFVIKTLTVNPSPSITSPSPLAVCLGSTVILTGSPAGGIFTISDTAIASIVISVGSYYVHGNSVGTTTITYLSPTGCSTIETITVNPLPSAITGRLVICPGTTSTLSDAGGGTWSSGNTSIATIGLSSGIVTGVATGTATITYTLPTGCFITTHVTVTVSPAPITGTLVLCAERSVTLHDANPYGTWSSSNASIATIDSSTGMLTGVTAGTASITYTNPCGYVTAVVTVDSIPIVSISAPFHRICFGITTLDTMTATVTGTGGIPVTYLWTGPDLGCYTCSSTTLVPGLIAGSTIYFVHVNNGACIVDRAYAMFVDPIPVIAGPTTICVDSANSITVSESSGTWSSSNMTVATVGSTGVTSAVEYGVTGGLDTIIYVSQAGCIGTFAITVNPHPKAIAGVLRVCVGSTVILHDPTDGGIWSVDASSVSIATVDPGTGTVTGLSAGTAVISYTTGCGFATRTVTVQPIPGPIIGALTVCQGSTTTLSDTMAGGTWSSSFSVIATIDAATGVATGVSGFALPDTIKYTLSTGCFVTAMLTVNPLPAHISGPTNVCVGDSIALTDIGEGRWSSSETSVATIDSITGIVTGLSFGTVTITYMLNTGCYVVIPIVVNPLPSVITGPDSVCPGTSIILGDTVGGGTWSSSNLSIATVDLVMGIITGMSSGIDTIFYSLGTGCYTTIVITVNPLPSPIIGAPSVCTGSSTIFTNATLGGFWTSSDTAIATIDPSTGVITGIAVGITIITYALPTGCLVTVPLVVITPSPIIGADSLCTGESYTLSDAILGGTWGSSVTSIATIDSLAGIVIGISPGTTIITYKLSTGCISTMILRVDALPVVPPITGIDTFCIGTLDTLSDSDTTGIWSTVSPYATVSSAGIVMGGTSGGIATISYSISNHCGTSSALFTVDVVVREPPIIGAPGVCSGTDDTLTNAVAGGTWSSSDESIATVSSSGVVTGLATGEVIITYNAVSPCGPFTVTKTIRVNMNPFISANFIVACQTLGTPGGDGSGPGPGTILPGTGCILVCEGSTVRYYGIGDASSIYTWAVTGGVITNNYGDSIDVYWPVAGTIGSVHLYDTVSHCTGEANVCIQVIQKPHALFSASSDSICLGDHVVFTDLSYADTASPIISWFWNFGDGTVSASEFPPTHTFTTPGHDTVMLVVKNVCNCSDTFRMVIYVEEEPGPDIVCPSIVCENEVATYSTSVACSEYDWSVTGGTIISGLGTASITVRWDAVGPTGYGLVNLAVSCIGLCADTTTIKVPVILQNAAISGPSVLCAGDQYQFSLPLWGGTQYMWGVLEHPDAIVTTRDDYKIGVEFLVPGTYTIHGWYQNRLKLCGGNIDKIITVVPKIKITGPAILCQNTNGTYSIPAGYTGDWTLRDSMGIAFSIMLSSNAYTTPILSIPGTYHLSVAGDFCADPVTIVVQPSPPPVDSLTGPDTVCLNRIYTYAAFKHTAGVIFNWAITGGSITPSSGTDSVTVIWTSTGPKILSVNLEGILPANCPGPWTTKNVIQELVSPNIAGLVSVCANSVQPYFCDYTRGEVYDWKILPDTAGSVVFGDHTPNISVQWNNFAGAADIVVSVRKCDSTVFDTLHVTVTMPPAITLTSVPNPACPMEPVTFTASSGGGTYTFNWGDGTGLASVFSPVTTHSFPLNTTTSNIVYNVTVTASGGSCPPSGAAEADQAIKPGPVAFVSTAANTNLCPTTSALLVVTVTNNVTGLTYQWEGGPPTPPAGATDTTYTTTYVSSPASYGLWCVATASNGCSAISNIMELHNLDSCGAPHSGTTDSGGTGLSCHVPVAVTSLCGTLTLSASTAVGDTGTWTAAVTPTSGPLPPYASTVTCSYDVPGIYRFNYFGRYMGCYVDTIIKDTLGIVPNYRWQVKCGSGGTDSVFLQDYTVFLPWWHIDSMVWDTSGVRIDSGIHLILLLGVAHTYTVTETVYGTMPDGPFVCTSVHTIDIPALPVAAFTAVVSPICETVPIQFTSTSSGGIVDYKWNFRSGGEVLSPNPKETFIWTAPSNPYNDSVTLTVTDSIGCTADTIENVGIFRNLLAGDLGDQFQTVCSGDRPLALTFTPTATSPTVVSYLWNTTETTNPVYVYQSGAYWVTVIDAHQCQKTIPIPPAKAVQVKVIYTPTAHIYGKTEYCVGDVVQLFGFLGTGVSYQWLRDGNPAGGTSGGTSPSLVDAGLAAGGYGYQLVIAVLDTVTNVICTDTSDINTVHVYKLPPNPAISGPTIVDCNTYHLQLAATDALPGYYNWSNGAYGPVDDIYVGGLYRVWFTDLDGCVSHADTSVPLSPDYYFQYFPTGCYTLCGGQLPLTLFGPPDVKFDYWGWLLNSETSLGGHGMMLPDTIRDDGYYQWELNNGLCDQQSDTMFLSIDKACKGCKQINLLADIACQDTNAASYIATISFISPGPGTGYTLGTDAGPVDPFSGALTGSGLTTLTLTFTTLYLSPVPDSITVELLLTLADGSKCFSKVKVPIDSCNWVAERPGRTDDTTKPGNANLQAAIGNALLVFPNPASSEVTISYDYGTWLNGVHHDIVIYDAMGRKRDYTAPTEVHGNWMINTKGWMPGIYVIRMEADGNALQTQRLVVVSK